MSEEKCELCGREVGRYVDSIEPHEYDGNTFKACDICRNYLQGEYTIDAPIL